MNDGRSSRRGIETVDSRPGLDIRVPPSGLDLASQATPCARRCNCPLDETDVSSLGRRDIQREQAVEKSVIRVDKRRRDRQNRYTLRGGEVHMKLKNLGVTSRRSRSQPEHYREIRSALDN